jgi:hypothetical protein
MNGPYGVGVLSHCWLFVGLWKSFLKSWSCIFWFKAMDATAARKRNPIVAFIFLKLHVKLPHGWLLRGLVLHWLPRRNPAGRLL